MSNIIDVIPQELDELLKKYKLNFRHVPVNNIIYRVPKYVSRVEYKDGTGAWRIKFGNKVPQLEGKSFIIKDKAVAKFSSNLVKESLIETVNTMKECLLSLNKDKKKYDPPDNIKINMRGYYPLSNIFEQIAKDAGTFNMKQQELLIYFDNFFKTRDLLITANKTNDKSFINETINLHSYYKKVILEIFKKYNIG